MTGAFPRHISIARIGFAVGASGGGRSKCGNGPGTGAASRVYRAPVTIDESDEQDVVVRPRLVSAAIVLWALDAIVYLGGSAWVMSMHKAQVDASMPNVPKGVTRDQVSTLLTIGEFTALGLGILAAVFVYLLMKGNRWSRVLLVVAVLLELVCQLLFGLVPAGTLLGLVGLALLWLPSSNAYFAGLKRTA